MILDDILIESSLGRIFQHVQRHQDDPDFSWAMMTSWRSEFSNEENNRNFRQFKQDVRSHGLGFIELEGHGQEEDGTVSEEPSMFIPEITLSVALKLAKKYDQFAIVYSGPETEDPSGGGRGVALIERDGDMIDIGSFRPNRVAQFFSKLKGKPFTFEGVRPSNNFERMLEKKKTEKAIMEGAMMKEGGWISPRGEVLLSTSTHVLDITGSPETFGFSHEEVKALHDKHGERIGQEGDAREHLIIKAVERGWIRFRRSFGRPSRWSITVNRLDRRTRNLLTDFFREAVAGIKGKREQEDDIKVHIVELATDRVTRDHSVRDIVGFSLLESGQEFEHTLVLKEWKDLV